MAGSSRKPEKDKPEKYAGKGLINSWPIHIDYLENCSGQDSLTIAANYTAGAAHEWWIFSHETTEGQEITTWPLLKNAVVYGLDTLNK